MKDFNLESRRLIIGGIAITVVVVYIIRLFTLQLASDDYKKNADSNASLKKIEFPSRGTISDRNGEFPGMLKNRKFNVVLRTPQVTADGLNPDAATGKTVSYSGKKVSVKL